MNFCLSCYKYVMVRKNSIPILWIHLRWLVCTDYLCNCISHFEQLTVFLIVALFPYNKPSNNKACNPSHPAIKFLGILFQSSKAFLKCHWRNMVFPPEITNSFAVFLWTLRNLVVMWNSTKRLLNAVLKDILCINCTLMAIQRCFVGFFFLLVLH